MLLGWGWEHWQDLGQPTPVNLLSTALRRTRQVLTGVDWVGASLFYYQPLFVVLDDWEDEASEQLDWKLLGDSVDLEKVPLVVAEAGWAWEVALEAGHWSRFLPSALQVAAWALGGHYEWVLYHDHCYFPRTGIVLSHLNLM